MDQPDPSYWRNKLEATRRKQVEERPKRAKAAMRALHKVQDRYTQALMMSYHLDRLIANDDPGPESDGSNREHLSRELERALVEVESVKSALVEAGAVLQSELDEARIEGASRSLRHEALSLLAQEKEATQATLDTASFSAGEYGAIGGEFFGLEGRMNQAIKDGDTSLVDEMTPHLESAKAKKGKAEAEMNEIQDRIKQIKAEYDRRIAALGKG